MTRNMPVLGLVPARGGSKGIVGKNMRLIDGDPMIAHTLRAARESGVIDRLVVSTEGNEIAQWCKLHGYEVIDRPDDLSTDEITIAQVTRHVIDELEWEGIVVALLPTSPLRGPEAIRRAVERAQTEEIDSLASVVREPKLFWYDESEGLDNPKPLYGARVNRQYGKHGVLRETGAILLVTTEALRSGGEMVGERHRLFELDHDEGLDIDAYDDLVVARRITEQGRIVFRISANWEVGSGHLWSCLALAEELTEHDCAFLLHKCDPFVTEMLDARGYEWMTQGDDLRSDLDTMKNGSSRNLLVNDMLDTTEEDVLIARTLGYKVVNVDDLGPGARFADWVVNPLYPGNFADASHISSGSKWNQTARDFHNLPPRVIRREPERILILFGGTDPSHFSGRFATALHEADLGVEIRVIMGPGAEHQEFPPEIVPARRVPSMAAEMLAADLAITAAGRTVYECAMTGTPVIALAANALEATHAHLGPETGVVYLGLGSFVDGEQLVPVVRRMLADYKLRSDLSIRLRKSIDSLGAQRIAHQIRGLIRGLS
jgi:CMP-N-acetylneuraminic acid synthetase/spore coat polysaccharide biosynthesis predicted glycosyltransferase SpsG